MLGSSYQCYKSKFESKCKGECKGKGNCSAGPRRRQGLHMRSHWRRLPSSVGAKLAGRRCRGGRAHGSR